jgi:hypothetical protein
MTISRLTPVAPAFLDKDLIADQTYKHLITEFNVFLIGFDAAKGLGRAANETTGFMTDCGGFNDQRVTATMQFPSPTVAGAEHIGVLLRCVQLSVSPNYYWIGISSGFARIKRMLNGVFTDLATVAYAVAQGVSLTITAAVVDSNISAKFVASSGPADVVLYATDTSFTRGFTGATSVASGIWVSAIKVEQL